MSRPASRVPAVDFLVVGAMKCATTTLVRALSAHPGIFLPERETHFFDQDDAYASVWRGGKLDAQRLHECYGAHFEGAGGRMIGTKAPSYMASALSMERAQRFHPAARVIVMLRDPVARAVSHWNHLVRARDNGRLDASLVRASFREHVERDARELSDRPTPDAELRRTNILHRGHYAPQVRRVRRLFPADRVFIGHLEDVKSAPDAFFGRLLAFLGAAPDAAVVRAGATERASRKTHTESLTSEDRGFLRDHYRASIAEMRELLGLPLDGWGAA